MTGRGGAAMLARAATPAVPGAVGTAARGPLPTPPCASSADVPPVVHEPLCSSPCSRGAKLPSPTSLPATALPPGAGPCPQRASGKYVLSQ